MKRSEAVELIWKRLGPIGISEETCSDVLFLLEEIGMLPPRSKLGALGTEDNAWEAEDG